MIKRTVLIWLLGMLTGQLWAQTSLTLAFTHLVGGDTLVLEKDFKNTYGETFSIRMLKYYVHHITLHYTNGQQQVFPTHYLINESDPTSKNITLPATATRLQSIAFTIGVDSTAQTTGVQTGSLDPLKGMFWTWQTGYVYAKIEGQSPQSTAQAHVLSQHIGGYKAPYNAARRITLAVPTSLTNNNILPLQVNIAQWFSGKHALPIQQHAVCHQPGALAMQFADNIATLFSINP